MAARLFKHPEVRISVMSWDVRVVQSLEVALNLRIVGILKGAGVPELLDRTGWNSVARCVYHTILRT